MSTRFHSRLRDLRVKAGLQQRELAERVGVSRQTLSALEAGESVPATTIALDLARALGCRVEDIFWLGDDERSLEAVLVGRPRESESGQGLRRRVAIAAVEERWVAHVLDGQGGSGFVAPADGLLTSGGSREGNRRSVRVRPLRESTNLRENLFCAGCDPALALLGAHLAERWNGGRLHWVEAGSGTALDMLADRQVHVAGVHLYDEESGEHNVAPVRRRLGGRPVVLVNLATWEQGLVIAAANPKKIRGVSDLGRKGVRVVARESGTGSQELFTRLAAEEGVARKTLEVVAVVHGHMAVAQTVAAGAADTGVTTRAAAACYGLDFLPLAEARFDLVMPRGQSEDARLQRLLDVLQSARFRRDLGGLAGYGTTRTGQVVAEVTT
jgi:molybdate-binding protein/DNA-binding XRE family transcriptional regulator